VDLNCDNVLHAPEGIWLIDFDRCRLRHPAQRWQQANLDRLQRSVAKRCHALPAAQRRALWAALMQGYAAMKPDQERQ
jgi:3-deoxy-D-manno-octulosonic acid kinase